MSQVGKVCIGRVDWFDRTKGFGFIKYPEGNGKDIFVHFSAIVDKETYTALNEEDEVEFVVGVSKTSSKLQAENVKVLRRVNEDGKRKKQHAGSSNKERRQK